MTSLRFLLSVIKDFILTSVYGAPIVLTIWLMVRHSDNEVNSFLYGLVASCLLGEKLLNRKKLK